MKLVIRLFSRVIGIGALLLFGMTPQAWGTSANALICNDWVQVSLPGDCEQEILPGLLLEGEGQPGASYVVELFIGVNSLGNTVDAGMIGTVLMALVTDVETDESCWSHLEVLDQWAPQFDCPQEAIILDCGQDPSQLPPPLLTDNCDENLTPFLIAELSETPACAGEEGLWEIRFRQWSGKDASGNEAQPCQQEIRITRGALSDVVFPPHLDGVQAPALNCGETALSPAHTGLPMLNGQVMPPDDPSFCGFTIAFSDLNFPGCGGTQKIWRTWTVWDECLPVEPGVNPLVYNQLIVTHDSVSPFIQCPDTLVVPLLGGSCEGAVDLPPLEISDLCSELTVSVFSPDYGSLSGNGGILTGLAPGVYPLVYTAVDDCGNIAECTPALQVIDGVAPVAICDEYTIVSLDNDGQAEVLAANLDDGSYDGCTEVAFGIRRMDDTLAFAPFAVFTCADAGADPVQVNLEVKDAFGNAVYCMVAVTVQDKIAPHLECPAAVELDCEQDYLDLTLTGEPEVWDACGLELGWSDLDQFSNLCGWGTIIRTFQAVDPSGNSAQCQQQITVVSDAPFTEAGITWPADYTFPDCVGPEVFHPDSLPAENAYPIFEDHACALIAVNYEDVFFDIATPACFQILRTWRVFDWCQFDPADPGAGGYWEHEQQLTVEDHTPPELFCSDGAFMNLETPDCVGTVELPPPVVKDCSPEIEIWVDSPLGEGFGPFPGVPLGSYPVTYTVSDECGNLSSCSFVLQVVDAKKPTPLCDNGLIVEIMQTGMVEIPASAFDEGSFDNCTAQEDLIFSFSPNPADSILLIDCATPAGLGVQIWVFDEFWNSDFCQTFIIVQDIMDACPPFPVTVAGVVEEEDGTGIADVELMVSDPADPLTLTDGAGQFVLDSLEEGVDYTLLARKDTDPLNGVTTYDMVLLARHILGVQPLDSPYKIIAADVNRSNSVTTVDLVELRKLVLHLESDFSNNSSWRFVDGAYIFPNPANPFETPFPEAIHLNDLTPGLPPVSFIAIKVGDVNGSAASE